MATPNVSGGGNGGDSTVAEAIASVMANSPTSTKNPNIVPLWKNVPQADSIADTVHRHALSKLDAMDQGTGDQSSSPSAPSKGDYMTKEAASSAFVDMTPDDQKAFRDKAIAAGLISPKATPIQILQAWDNMVQETAGYNSSHPQQQWISPWQYVDKVAPNLAADSGASFDAFASKSNTSIKQYSQSDLTASADSILKSELGRAPTQAELQAFTIAVNHASVLNPVTTTSTPTKVDPQGNPLDTITTTTGGIDPNQIMLDQVRSSPEHATYQAAADLYPAAMKALGAIV